MTRSITIFTFADQEKEKCDERYGSETEQRPPDHHRGGAAQGQYNGSRDGRDQCKRTGSSCRHGSNLSHHSSHKVPHQLPSAMVESQEGCVDGRLMQLRWQFETRSRAQGRDVYAPRHRRRPLQHSRPSSATAGRDSCLPVPSTSAPPRPSLKAAPRVPLDFSPTRLSVRRWAGIAPGR